MATERKNKGRQKIELAKMVNKSNLLVTFSKRRADLLKKASEICNLCDAEVAIAVFTRGKKVSSFGHPNAKAVIDRFLTKEFMTANPGQSSSLVETHQNPRVAELNMQLTELLEQLEVEKKRNKTLRQMKEADNQMKHWWDRPVEELDLDELEKLKKELEDIKIYAKMQNIKFCTEGSSSNSYVGSNVSMP